MKVHLEPLSAMLRVFADGKDFGDPYEWCCAVRHVDTKTVELVGALDAPLPSYWRAIGELF